MESVQAFQTANSDELVVPDALQFLLTTAQANGVTKADLVKISGLERTYAYHLLAGEKKLTRDKLLLFASAGRLNLEQTQQLLKYAGLGVLYARDKRDGVLIYGINKHFTVQDMEELLEELGLELLRGKNG